MADTPIPSHIVEEQIAASGLTQVGKGSIREIVRLVSNIEQASGQRFVRMEMGVPGLEPPQVAIEAEIAALRKGVASKYPVIDGIPELKREMARFVKNFIGVEVNEQGCVPTVGSMQGGMAAFLLTNRFVAQKDTVLFIDPGFPVQKQQLRVLGMKYETFDVYQHRGDKLRPKLEEYL